MHPLLQQLRGADLRSIGQADAVVQQVLSNPELATVLLTGIEEADPVVRMRSADAYEKLTSLRPELAGQDAVRLFALLSQPQAKEVLWHLLQIAPRVRWPRRQLQAVLRIVESAWNNDSPIVKAGSLQAAVELLPQAPSRRTAVGRWLRNAEASPVPAVAARARKLRRLFDGSG